MRRLKHWKDRLIVILLLPVTVYFGGIAIYMALSYGGSALLIFMGKHAWRTEILADIQLFLIGAGGLMGLIGMWMYILSGRHLTSKKTWSTYIVVVFLIAGIGSSVSVIKTMGFSGINIIDTYNFVLLLLALFYAYAALKLLRPNKRLQSDSAPPSA